jgi:hypothetical protein
VPVLALGSLRRVRDGGADLSGGWEAQGLYGQDERKPEQEQREDPEVVCLAGAEDDRGDGQGIAADAGAA